MYRIAISTATLLTMCWHDPSLATTGNSWMCALSEDAVRLVCVADIDPVDTPGQAPQPSAMVNGTAFPLDPGRMYTVDLWSPPTDMAFVEQLARATICYRSPGCSVTMAGSPWVAHSLPAAASARKPALR
jgi:hypothetical protein